MEHSFIEYLLESNLINFLIVVLGLSVVASKAGIGDKLSASQTLISKEFEDAQQLQNEIALKVEEAKKTLASLEQQYATQQQQLHHDIEHYKTHKHTVLETTTRESSLKVQRTNELLSNEYAERLLNETVHALEAGMLAQTQEQLSSAERSEALMWHWISVLEQQLPKVHRLLNEQVSTQDQATCVEEHYALALWCQANQQQVAHEVQQSLSAICKLIAEHPAMQAFCQAPHIAATEKQCLLDELLQVAQAPRLLQQFMKLVIEAGRLPQLPRMYDAFQAFAAQQGGHLVVRLRTSHPLSQPHQQQLEAVLKTALHVSDVSFEIHVDASLVHGLSLVVHGFRMDANVRSGLQQLTTHMLAN